MGWSAKARAAAKHNTKRAKGAAKGNRKTPHASVKTVKAVASPVAVKKRALRKLTVRG
jgi:hypothetical protein